MYHILYFITLCINVSSARAFFTPGAAVVLAFFVRGALHSITINSLICKESAGAVVFFAVSL